MKINIKTTLKNKEETHTYEGKAIKDKNIIIYKDKNTYTKIKIDKIITIERKNEYQIKINLKKGIKLKGSYITKYGKLDIETYAKEVISRENHLKLVYDLIINNEFIDTFIYYCEYSIDS